jgi:hypothetical protein
VDCILPSLMRRPRCFEATVVCHPEDFENAGVIFGAGMT